MKFQNFFAILILVFLVISLQATNYYIDATNGNDNNNGISPTMAWKTITKVNSQTFAAGDSILFKRNEIFRGRLVPQNSGNSNNIIVYSAYGTGENPQLLGTELLTNWTHLSGFVYIKSNLNYPSYAGKGLYEFDNTSIYPIILIEDTMIPTAAGHYYYDKNLNSGTVYVFCSDSLAPNTHNMEFCRYKEIIDVQHQSYINFSNLSLKFGNCKNIVMYKSDHLNITNINSSFVGHYGNPNIFSIGCDYVKIENCVLYESNNSGITFYPADVSRPGHYNIVRGCIVTKVFTNDGIGVHQNSSGEYTGDHYLFENNVVSECAEGSFDITSGNYHICRNNICFNNKEDAIQIGHDADHLLIENNICYGNERHGIIAFGDINDNSTGFNIIRNNIIYDNKKYGLMSGMLPIAMYNNTICNSLTRSEIYFGYQGNPVGTRFKNNIVYNDNYNSDVRFSHGLPPLVEMNSNNYNVLTSDSLNFRISQISAQYTLLQMQSIYNCDFNSFVASPSFVNALNKDYHLNANSPCINSGCFLTKTTSAGSGTQIPVDDVIYFCDGFGIVGGDTIQLQGQTQSVVITNIDTATNTITVNQNLSWNMGDGVSLKYSGTAPDVGAYEYSSPIGFSISHSYNDLIIFPNPTSNEIFFSEKLLNSNYQIISESGAIVKNGVIDGNKISLRDLNNGIYFIRIINNVSNKISVLKLIKY